MLKNIEVIKKTIENINILLLALYTVWIVNIPKEEVFWKSEIEGTYIIESHINPDSKVVLNVSEIPNDNLIGAVVYYFGIFIIFMIIRQWLSYKKKRLENEKQRANVVKRKYSRKLRRVR